MENVSGLKDAILDISKDRDKYIKMGENAYSYYWTNRTPEIMAQGIQEAIEYSLSIK